LLKYQNCLQYYHHASTSYLFSNQNYSELVSDNIRSQLKIDGNWCRVIKKSALI